jgi:hypothetical protein
MIRRSWWNYACAVALSCTTGTGIWRAHDVACRSLPFSRLLGPCGGCTTTWAIARHQPHDRMLGPGGSARRRPNFRVGIHVHHSRLDQLRAAKLLPHRRRSRTERCPVGSTRGPRVAGARWLRTNGSPSIPRSSRTFSSRHCSGRARTIASRRGSGALQRVPPSSRASDPRGFLRSARPSSTGRLIVGRRSIRHGRSASPGRTRRATRNHIEVTRNRCSRRSGAAALGRFIAWPFGAQLPRERPVVLTGARFSSARCRREPPDVGTSPLRSWRCRCIRLPMCRARLRGRSWRAAFRGGLGTACWLRRTVEMRLCPGALRIGGRVLPLGGCGLLVGGHAHVPPNRVRWVGTPDWVESRFGWVLPGCGIAVRPLPRLIHRRRFTVLCWSRDGTAPAPLARG